MAIFLRKTESKPEPDVDPAIEQLTVRMEQVERALSELEHIEVEWSDWFEKYKNLYARLNKRVQREEAKDQEEEPAPINPAAARLLGTRHGG